ncbi:hybrid sensor histidine kinase/response regulator transcription factor [Salinimicrobium sp. HB62]|uniref:hybrid sensor histidine kinase/response regulator transcription factor n=1 Tax=Salinimicrobium sp. HB62 TaxID=3077781 RepID=UPI002D787614|nr:two-component regulator propeller domain-containing protein [Salinimicrobium sp. HB62]
MSRQLFPKISFAAILIWRFANSCQKVQVSYSKRPYFLFFLFFLYVAFCFGQEKPLQKYQFEDLSNIPTQRAVATISQDQQGFIWMGTNGLGLNRYDGLDYAIYQYREKDSTSLSNSLVHATFVDEKNRLWVGTEMGLDLYNRDLDNFLHIPMTEEGIEPAVHSILNLGVDELLVGTHEDGIFRVNSQSLESFSVEIEGVSEIRNFLINDFAHFDHRIVVGTDRGLFEFDKEQNKLYPLTFMTLNGRERITAHVQSFAVDQYGTLWVGTTTQGLYRIEGNENGRYVIQHFPITSKRILSLLATPRKTMLCGTENDGMFELDRHGKILKQYLSTKDDDKSIKSNSIWSLFLDHQERIWIGYYNNGVAVYDRLSDKFADIESKLNNSNTLQANSVTGILKDEKGRTWIGMDGGGIDVYHPQSHSFTHLLNNRNNVASGLHSPDVQTLFKDSKGNIWVGTWDHGIYLLKKGSTSFINYNIENTEGEIATNRILSFTEDSKGTIWIGTFSRGLHSYDPRSGKFSVYDQEPFLRERISYSNVRKVYVDSQDQLWIGGNPGLFRLKIQNGKYFLEVMSGRFYAGAGKRSFDSQVLDIYEDSSQRIWIGTDGAGLSTYDMKTDRFSWIKPEDGLDKLTVSSVVQDNEGNIWAAGNNGLAKLDRTNNSIKNFTINDGLLSNDFNNSAVYKDRDGTLYFGSYEGVNFFNPAQLTSNNSPSKVYFTDLKIFNQSVKPGEEASPLDKVISQTRKIELHHSQSVFTIDFASIDFTRPEKIYFAYYLQGFEDKWNYVQNTRSATYTNLPAGDYTFKVKAANSDGIWGAEPASVQITILRPWWFTNLAITGYILLILGLCFLFYRYFNSRIKHKRLIEQERERHLQEEVLNDKKIQFFTNISHEFRTPLTLILSPLQDILHNDILPEKLKRKLNIINKNTVRLKRLVDELMDFRKLQLDEIPLKISEFRINSLLEESLEYFREEAQQRNIALTLESENKNIMIRADKGKLEKILFNLLSNAFKSTPNNGIITLAVAIKQEHHFRLTDEDLPLEALEISIEDTGKGIPTEELDKIFERFYQIKDLNEQYYSGTGIGLEVVKSFVELHKGDIKVESESGVGTKFTILLPLNKTLSTVAEVIDPETAYQKHETRAHELAKPEFEKQHKKTLLLVEDNLELRSYLQEELSFDYRVLTALDGIEAIEKADKYLPDVVVTDVVMPNMSGIEFCSQLKKNIKTSHIPVLMLTAKSQSDDLIEGLEAGADVYLTKPFEMKVMRSQLKQLLSTRALLYSKYIGDFKKAETEPGSISLDQQFILEIIRYTRQNIKETNLNVEKLAKEFNLSRSQLYRKIKTLTGLTANELIRKIRLERAKELLEESASSVSEISYAVGFSSPSYFSKCFKSHFGILPKELKEE